jgi:hypothetical protein
MNLAISPAVETTPPKTLISHVGIGTRMYTIDQQTWNRFVIKFYRATARYIYIFIKFYLILSHSFTMQFTN